MYGLSGDMDDQHEFLNSKDRTIKSYDKNFLLLLIKKKKKKKNEKISFDLIETISRTMNLRNSSKKKKKKK